MRQLSSVLRSQLELVRPLGLFAILAVAMAGLSGQAMAEEVDLAAAGCPEVFPDPADQLALWIVLEPDGSASECIVSTTTDHRCERAFDSRAGFLAMCFNAANKDLRDIGTAAEGPQSSKVEAFYIDGRLVEPEFGYPNSHLTAPFGSGPSGSTYDVVAETVVGGTRFSARLNVTATKPNEIQLNAIKIEYSR